MNPTPWYKNKVVIGVSLAVLVILLAVIIKSGSTIIPNTKPVDLTDSVAALPKSTETLITGKLNCLPFRNKQEITTENCVLGLISDDGKAYALDTVGITILSKTLKPQDEVRVVGTLETPAAAVSENAFDIVGVLAVRALQRADIAGGSTVKN
jgi:hypothetical protein